MSFNIYQNGRITNNVPYTTTSITISSLTLGETYSFYITSLIGKIESEPSNVIQITL